MIGGSLVTPGCRERPDESMTLNVLLIGLLIFLILGTLPTWPYSKAWDYYPSSVLGVIFILLLMLVLLERI